MSSASLLVNFQCSLDSLGDFYAVLLVSPEIPLGHLLQDPVTLLDGVSDPPAKGWEVVYLISNSILRDFHRITFLHVLEGNPTGSTILPLNTQLDSLGGPLGCSLAMNIIGRLFIPQSLVSNLVVQDLIQQSSGESFFIDLCIDVLSNDVSSK